MAYKHILNIYNLLLEERGLQPVNIDLHPVVRLNNNNNARILNNYYTDELYIEKIQILYAILNTPLDTDPEDMKKNIYCERSMLHLINIQVHIYLITHQQPQWMEKQKIIYLYVIYIQTIYLQKFCRLLNPKPTKLL